MINKGSRKFRKRARHHHWFLIVLIALVVLGVTYYVTCLSRPGDKSSLTAKAAGDVRVATININGFRSMHPASLTGEFLLREARMSKVDILFLQEYFSVYQLDEKDFKKMFSAEYPYILLDDEQAVVSKYPIVGHKFIKFPDSFNTCAVNTINIAGTATDFVSVHLQTTGLFNFVGDMTEDPVKASKNASGAMFANRTMRVSQARKVREEIDAASNPVVVVGDFNSLPYSKVYRTIKGRDMYDSYMETGGGKGSTFRLLMDVLRIDYILTGYVWEAADFFIPDSPLSDHRMVVSTLRKY